MSEVHDRVRKEHAAFIEALPGLLESDPGKWVIFIHGAVQGKFDSEDAAFRTALERFGADGGFIVAQVKPVQTTPVTAAVLYSAP